MRTTIDKAGRVVIPREIRERVGIVGPAEVEISDDDGAVRIEPVDVGSAELIEKNGVLVIKGSGRRITDEDVRRLRLGLQR